MRNFLSLGFVDQRDDDRDDDDRNDQDDNEGNGDLELEIAVGKCLTGKSTYLQVSPPHLALQAGRTLLELERSISHIVWKLGQYASGGREVETSL